MSIHILDRYTDKIKDYLTNKPDKKIIIEDLHIRNIESHSETYDFTVDYAATENIQSRDRVLIPDEEIGQYREFVVDEIETDTYDGETEIKTVASYLEDLEKARPIEPNTIEQYTTQQAVEYALTSVDWEVGAVEYGGFRTISWTGVNSPFELLKIIANRFDLQLDFTIEIDGNEISKRLVHLKEKTALFDGKEVRRGKDLENLQIKRTSTDVVTALLALAPEPEEGKERITAIVVDDEAQAQYGREQDYIWGIYEPESDDQNITKSRLETLARTQLNKLKNPKTDYTIDAVDLEQFLGHEKVRIGDKIRIKDDLQEPYFYADATVKEVKRSIFNPLSKSYVLGDVTEYTKEDITKIFQKFRDLLSKKMAETNSNINNIVEIIDTAVERRIWKQPTPPKNPTNGQLWLDTSNPDKPILKEYYNGVWVERISAVKDPEDIGAISREQALYESILSSLRNFEVLHMQLLTEANIITTNKYLNQTNIDNINEKLQMFINTYNQLKAEVNKHSDSKRITLEQANYIHQLMLNYSNAVKDLQQAIVTAQNYAMEHLAILQAQYTDEKFTEAIEVTAERLGFIVEDDVIKLSPDSPVSGVIEALRQDTEEQFKSVVKQVDYDADKEGIVGRLDAADSERTQLSNEIKDRVTLTDYSKDKTAQTGRITTLETSVTQNGKAITLKASQDDLDSVERTLSTRQAQLEVKADGIESNVKGLNDDLAQAKTSLNQSIDGITQQVSANKKGITDANSKIEQKANEITSEVNLVKEGVSSGVVTYKDVDRTDWKNLAEVDGSLFDDAYSYDLSAKTVGTNTESLIVSLISRGSGKGWDMSTREDDGTSAFRPNIYTITGGVRVRTAGTVTSRYSIDVAYTKYAGVGTGLSWTNSKITQTADEINSEVSKKVGNNEIISRINQSAEKITINASKVNISGASINISSNPAITKLEKEEVGGANLLRGTTVDKDNLKYLVSVNGGTSNVDPTVSGLDGVPFYLIRETAGASSSYISVRTNGDNNTIHIRKGQTYVLSFVARKSSYTDDFRYTYLMRPNAEGANYNLGSPIITDSSYPNANRYTFKFTAPWTTSDAHLLLGLRPSYSGGSQWFRYRELTLQEGDKAGSYAPHPDEVITNDTVVSSINLDKSGVRITGKLIDLVGDVSMVNGNVKVRQLSATSGGNTLTMNGNTLTMSGNTGTLTMGNDGITYRNSGGGIRYEMNENFVRSSTFGTTTANIYLAASAGYEVRFVDIRDIPGAGAVNDYRYIDTRAHTMYAKGVSNNSKHSSNLDLGADGYVRVMNNGHTTLNTLWAAGIRTDFVDLNASGNSSDHMYIRTRDEVRFTANGSTTSYRGVRANQGYFNSVWSHQYQHLNLRVDTEVRAVAHGSTTTFRDIRGLFGYFDALDVNTGAHIYVRPKSGNEMRVTRTGTTGTYEDIRFKSWYATSSEQYKTDINKWDYNVLDILKNDVQLYSYKFKSELEDGVYARNHHGVIIEREIPIEWRHGDGVDNYEMNSWTLKGVQELAHENDELKAKNEELEERLEKLEQILLK